LLIDCWLIAEISDQLNQQSAISNSLLVCGCGTVPQLSQTPSPLPNPSPRSNIPLAYG
jgi:hypothetical protein